MSKFLQKTILSLLTLMFMAAIVLPSVKVFAASPNLIANPSVETPDPNNPSQPQGWLKGGWGTNQSNLTYLNNGHTGSFSINVQTTSYTSGDAKWYFTPVSITPGVQYTYSDYYQASEPSSVVAQFDNGSGNYSYSTIGNVNAVSSWSKVTSTFVAPSTAKYVTVFHLIAGVGSLQTDDFSLTSNTVNPSLSITSPTDGTAVSGQVSISAAVNNATGASVQFQVDSQNVGNSVVASPYQITWDSTTVSNGAHSISAVMNVNGQLVSSSPISVQVSNSTGTPGNMLPNPSVETPNPNNSNLPKYWNHGSWGKNSPSFSYLNTGHTGSRSLKTQLSSFSSGSAYWFDSDLKVVPGQMYNYSDYYQSNVMSELDATFTMSDGSFQYVYLGDAFISSHGWTKFVTQFTAPAGAVSVTIYHDIYSVGWVITDDFSLQTFSYQGFNRPIVSLTFDDGYQSFFDNGFPLLKQYGFSSTDYIISGAINNDPGYMTSAELLKLQAGGQEIGSHTVTHPDLSTMSTNQITNELKNSQTTLQGWLGVPVTDFAAPYGVYNQQLVTMAQQYYTSYRGVHEGFNAKNNLDPFNIQVQNIDDTTTPAQVDGWINTAISTHTWLVLVYHQVDPSSAAGQYNTYPQDLNSELSYLKSSGVAVETMGQALQELRPQL